MRTRYRVENIGSYFNPKNVLVLQIWKTWPDGIDDRSGRLGCFGSGGWEDATPEDLINIQKV